MPGSLTLDAHAKINLGLRITGRRSDGYHLLHTLFAEIEYGDRITLAPRDDGQLTLEVSGPSAQQVPAGGDNLCLQAADLMRRETGRQDGVHIMLDKQVPPGSGLGGGSSDCAAVLKGLNELWTTQLSDDLLEVMATELGADVPFFIRGGVQLGEGIGDILALVKLAQRPHVVLVLPELAIDTAWAYSLLPNRTGSSMSPGYDEIAETSPVRWDLLENDFEAVIFPRHPELAAHKAALIKAGALYAGLSGSGSAVVGLFESPPENLTGVNSGAA